MKRVLVANRGEIAFRIVRACRKVGVESVAVYSEADRHSPHVWAADNAVCIGPPPSSESYLSIERLLLAATASGADAVHPGYGFLAENAAFARACRDANLIYIGPRPESIELMGDKVRARQVAAEAGVRVVPGTEDGFTAAELAEALEAMEEIGFPLLLKAAAGGGGRGMRVVRTPDAFESNFKQASREAEAAFGDGTVYLERYFDKVRHIEVQVLSDRHGRHRHLGERDCTIQRRHQKLIEESPSPVLTETQRAEVCEMAVALAQRLDYENAGTVEFLFDIDGGGFYFIEMNTRVQVEHPVTEMVTGADIVAEQLRIAADKQLRLKAPERPAWGHAIEWRINAEDASKGFMPSPGMIRSWDCPRDKAVRLDSHVYPGYTVPTQYDSLLGKLIIGGKDRQEALDRSRRVLGSFSVAGVSTTIPFYQKLIEQADFCSGSVYTGWVDDNIGRLYDSVKTDQPD